MEVKFNDDVTRTIEGVFVGTYTSGDITVEFADTPDERFKALICKKGSRVVINEKFPLNSIRNCTNKRGNTLSINYRDDHGINSQDNHIRLNMEIEEKGNDTIISQIDLKSRVITDVPPFFIPRKIRGSNLTRI